jgi:glycerol-3-phosphate dehydrogenase (NAD(P)+)
MKNRIAVLGAGSWGTALSVLLAGNGNEVNLWSRNQEQCLRISEDKENKKYLPGVTIPPLVTLCNEIKEAVSEVEFIVSAVPSHSVREIAQKIRPYLRENMIIINTAKGFEPKTYLRPTQVLKEELSCFCHDQITILSGPSHAEEVGNNLPTAIVVAAGHQKIAEKIQDLFMNQFFRVYINNDIIGVELAGALKNVIALGTGISDGLGYGDNAKAALITRGLAEMTRLGVFFGADAKTFSGLAGLGDLVVTCTSMHSRNRRAGIQIGQGKPLEQVLSNMGMVVEGVNTTQAVFHLASQSGVVMPISEQMYQVLFEGKDPKNAVISLMTRSKTHEGEKEMLISRDTGL